MLFRSKSIEKRIYVGVPVITAPDDCLHWNNILAQWHHPMAAAPSFQIQKNQINSALQAHASLLQSNGANNQVEPMPAFSSIEESSATALDAAVRDNVERRYNIPRGASKEEQELYLRFRPSLAHPLPFLKEATALADLKTPDINQLSQICDPYSPIAKDGNYTKESFDKDFHAVFHSLNTKDNSEETAHEKKENLLSAIRSYETFLYNLHPYKTDKETWWNELPNRQLVKTLHGLHVLLTKTSADTLELNFLNIGTVTLHKNEIRYPLLCDHTDHPYCFTKLLICDVPALKAETNANIHSYNKGSHVYLILR